MIERFTFASARGRSGRRKLLIATLAAIVIVAADFFLGGVLRIQVRRAVSYVWTTGESIHQSIRSSGYFASHRVLASENAALREQVAQYAQKAAAYDAQSQENTSLRSLVHIAQEQGGVTAPIISALSSAPFGTFQIGAGVGDVAPGDIVITDGGFVIGTITDVGSQSSLVREVFAAGQSIDVRIAGASVVSDGYGGGNARASVPRGIHIIEGDSVTAPSFGGRPVGVVGSVSSDPANADQTIYMRLPANFSSLRFVYVVHSKK